MGIKHQVAINATETVKGNNAFKREDQIQGVMIKGYHTDNGVFNATYNNQQNIKFSGAGSSYQNGAAERSIKAVVTMARTMLMRAALRCTEEKLSTDIWPMDMDYAVWTYNWIPDI